MIAGMVLVLTLPTPSAGCASTPGSLDPGNVKVDKECISLASTSYFRGGAMGPEFLDVYFMHRQSVEAFPTFG